MGEGRTDEVCACCGIAGVDDIKLKDCDGGCDLVKYCGDECQENNREHHEEECKRRKAELHDKELFTQPDGSHLGECPICCLPLSLDMKKSRVMGCCCKMICIGCSFANIEREIEGGLELRCAFCREPMPNSEEEAEKYVMKRIEEHDDPVAMTQVGKQHQKEGDYGKALGYWTKAAELGDVDAHFWVGSLYYKGQGVEKDITKAVYHLEQAAIGGHSDARVLLADYEEVNGRLERAVKHLLIAANLGDDTPLIFIKMLVEAGRISEEDYAAALRGYQAAVNETKSAEREKAEVYDAALMQAEKFRQREL